MMKDKRGFIAISLIYSFFVVFLMLLLIILNSYFNNRTSFDIYKDNIKVKAASWYSFAGDNTNYLTNEIKNQASLTGSSTSGVKADGSSYGSYRYFGKAPNNYICFGKSGNSCSDNKYLFRIVGIFKESNVAASGGSGYVTKIVRANPLSSKKQYNSVYTSNAWSSSSLKTYLNDTYLNSTVDSNFEDKYKNQMIINARWYAPSHNTTSLTAKDAYTKEMSSSRINAKIGLLAISDWGYASASTGSCNIAVDTMNNYNNGTNQTCYLYNWLNADMWFIDGSTYTSGSTKYAMTLSSGTSKYNLTYASVTTTKLVYPTFYLNKNVVVLAGTGTKVDPYIINMA